MTASRCRLSAVSQRLHDMSRMLKAESTTQHAGCVNSSLYQGTTYVVPKAAPRYSRGPAPEGMWKWNRFSHLRTPTNPALS